MKLMKLLLGDSQKSGVTPPLFLDQVATKKDLESIVMFHRWEGTRDFAQPRCPYSTYSDNHTPRTNGEQKECPRYEPFDEAGLDAGICTNGCMVNTKTYCEIGFRRNNYT